MTMTKEPAQPVLSDGVIELAPFELSDASTLARWNQDPEAQRWFDWPTEVVPEDEHLRHCGSVIRRWKEEWGAGTRAPFLVREAQTGKPLGSCELRREDDRWSVSYLTLAEHRGRGIATRALKKICAWAFESLGVEHIHLQTAEANQASLAVARKTGFRQTGRRPDSTQVSHYQPECGVIRTMVHQGLTAQDLTP